MESKEYVQRPLWKHVLEGVLVLGLLLAMGLTGLGVPQEYPNCNWNCTAGDVEIEDVWLDLSSGACGCDPNQTTPPKAELWVRLKNHTGTERYDIAFIGELFIGGSSEGLLEGCENLLDPGMTADLYLGEFDYICGQAASLGGVVVSWVSSGQNTTPPCTVADFRCSSRAAHCYAPDDLVIQLPLSVSASISDITDCREVTITASATGGVGTLTYVWHNLPPGMAASGDTASGSLPDGIYSSPPNGIYVTVTDERPCTVDSNPIDEFGIACGTDLSIGKTGSPDPVEVPDSLLYTITVQNTGSVDATNVVVLDDLPERLTYVSSSCPDCSGGECSHSAGVVTCTVGTLAAGATSTITIEVLAECPPLLPGQLMIDPASCEETISNTASVTCDNADPASVTVTTLLQDTTAPTFVNCPADVTAECSNVPPAQLVTATDNCDPSVQVTLSEETTPSGVCPGEYSILRTWTATDDCGNTAICTQTVTVQDTTPPVITTCPPSLELGCTDPVPQPSDDWNGFVQMGGAAEDLCDTQLEADFLLAVSSGCGQNEILTLTWTVTDDCGNTATCEQTITVVDTTPPEITCPDPISVQCVGDVPAADIGLVMASDNCDPNPLVTWISDSPLDPDACGGTITRTYRATDACGNWAECTQTITVDDTIDPWFDDCPADVTVECDSVPLVPTLTASDNCDLDVDVTYDGETRIDGPCPDSYQLVRTWTATDDCQNTATCEQTITVQDTTPPAITDCPDDLDLECDEPVPYPSNDWAGFVSAGGAANDNCDTELTASYGDSAVGACPTVISRRWTVTDDCGWSDSCTQTITVDDTTDPQITCPGPILVQCVGDVPDPDVSQVSASDNCDPSPIVTWISDSPLAPDACGGTITRTYRATDACGNWAECTQTITVDDTIDPWFDDCPADVTVECDSVPLVPTLTASDNCDLDVDVTYDGETRIDGPCPDSYQLVRTWTATDDCQNTVTCTQTITVQDTTPPEITAWPDDTTVQCLADVPLPDIGAVSAHDNCSTPLITWEGDVGVGPCPTVITRTYRATDDCGLIDEVTQTITVDDTIDPWFDNCPPDETVECDSIPLIPTLTASDNCDLDVDVTYNGETRIDGNCDDNYQLVRTWTATDDCGNTATCTQTITVQDTTPPEITAWPDDTTVQCLADVPLPDIGAVSAQDNCSTPMITWEGDVAIGPCPTVITRTYRATDDCGLIDEVTQTINVDDTIDPWFDNCPPDETVECDSIPLVPTLTASDNCDLDVDVTYNGETRIDGDCPYSYQLVRTWTATDDCGNTATCTQTITVQDTTPPEITAWPDDTTVQCLADVPLPDIGAVSAQDNCSTPLITWEGDVAVGPCPTVITRTYRATDDCGLIDEVSQTITVDDTTDPWFDDCPVDETVECDNVPLVPTLTASDNCDLDVDVTYNGETRIDGDCPYSYQLVRTWTATDDCGNTATCTQTITVQDTTPPVIVTCPPDIVSECRPGTTWPPDHWVGFVNVGGAAVDNCDTELSASWQIVDFESPCPRRWRVEWTISDACGNTATCIQTVTMTDTTDPWFDACPADVTVECDSVPEVPTLTASDECDRDVEVTFDGETRIDGNCDDNYQLVRTWTATDDCGNTATCTQTITVQDTTPPEITALPDDTTVECLADVPLPDTGAVSAQDNCSTPMITWEGDVAVGPCPTVITRTYRATDDCGLIDEVTQTITVDDTTDPWFDDCPVDATVECDNIPLVPTLTASDNCDLDVDVTYNGEIRIDGTCDDNYQLVRTWTATDDCGNTATCAQTITVQDTTPPEIITCPLDLDLDCTETVPLVTNDWTGFVASGGAANDSCDAQLAASYSDSFTPGCGITGVITRNWVVTDNCGLSDTCVQTITITDTTSPNLTCPQDLTLECGDPTNEAQYATWLASATATDDCSTPTVAFVAPAFDELVPECAPGEGAQVAWTATDPCGNQDTCSATVRILDTTPPEITSSPEDVTTACVPDPDTSLIEATDACWPPLVTWEGDVADRVECPRTITRTYRATDACGLYTDVTQRIVIVDDTPPVIACPPDIERSGVGIGCDRFVTVPPIRIDDPCGIVSITNDFTGSENASGIYPLGETVVTWTVIDECGNVSRCSHTVTVLSNPRLTLSKTVEPPFNETPANPGDVLEFTLILANTGDTDLFNVTVEDPLLGTLRNPEGDELAPDVLEIGETWLFTGLYEIRADSECEITNSAKATAYDPCGVEATATGTVTVDTTLPCGGGGGGSFFGTILVNEIAWAGTQYSPEHEWVELLSTRATPTDLDEWILGWRHRRQPDESISPVTTLEEFRASEPEDERWEIELGGVIDPQEFFLLERYVEDVVSDLEADLVYAKLDVHESYDPDALRLSDLMGEEVYLFNPEGFVVSAANTDYAVRAPGGSPWPGGSLLPASMERKGYETNPVDVDDYWTTNQGIVIFGLDAERVLLTATARAENEQVVMTSLYGDPLDRLSLEQGDPLSMMFDLRDWMASYEEFPRVTIYAGRIVVADLGTSPLDPDRLVDVLRVTEDEVFGPHALIDIKTEEFAPAEYTIFVTLGSGLTYRLDLTITAKLHD